MQAEHIFAGHFSQSWIPQYSSKGDGARTAHSGYVLRSSRTTFLTASSAALVADAMAADTDDE